MRNSDKQNARVEHGKALQRAIVGLLTDHTELFKQFSDNTSFKQWLSEQVFDLTYQPCQPARFAAKPWRESAIGQVSQRFGQIVKWRGITDGLASYFEANAGEPIMLSGIEKLAGELQVTVEDVVAILQVLSIDDIGLLERTYSKLETTDGEIPDVATGEIRTGLASLFTRGELSSHGEQFARSVVIGWKPLTDKNSSSSMKVGV
ncbi:MAG: hypothetical protein V4568_09350 [Pseudomonadota bacterium]